MMATIKTQAMVKSSTDLVLEVYVFIIMVVVISRCVHSVLETMLVTKLVVDIIKLCCGVCEFAPRAHRGDGSLSKSSGKGIDLYYFVCLFFLFFFICVVWIAILHIYFRVLHFKIISDLMFRNFFCWAWEINPTFSCRLIRHFFVILL